jgi:hypothetical protein
MLAPDHDTVTCASDVLERARQHHAWRRQAFAQPRRRAVLKVVEPEPKPEPAPAPVQEPEEWPEPGESFALWWVQVKDRPGVNAKELFTLWQQMRASERLKAALESKPAGGKAEQPALDEPEPKQQRVRVAGIIKAVAAVYGVTAREIVGDGRQRALIEPRHVAMFLAHGLTKCSLPEIGRRIGGRDHSTVRHGVYKIKEAIRSDAELASRVEAIRCSLTPVEEDPAEEQKNLGMTECFAFSPGIDPVKNEMADAVLATPAGRDQEPEREVPR